MTKQKYKEIQKLITNDKVKLIDILKDFSLNENFYLGSNSAYFFYGNIIDLYRDMHEIEDYYWLRTDEETPILESTVIRTHMKTWYEPKPVIAIIISGDRIGKVWFPEEYYQFIKDARESNKRNQNLLTKFRK